MIDLSGYEFSILHEDELTLCRGSGHGLEPILLVVPSSESPTAQCVNRFCHEYALRAEVDPYWAAVPLGLVTHGHRPALVLRDPGGLPLCSLLGRALEVSQFLVIAISLAAACSRMHARGVVHKDIKPGNVLVDLQTRHAWLSGFGIASRLSRE